MFPKKTFPFVMPFWICLIVVSIMSVVMGYVNAGAIHFPGILWDIAIGTAVAYAASVLLPVNKWSAAFTELLKLRHGTLLHTLMGNIIPTLVMGILMTLLFTWMAIGFPPYFLAACISSLPLGLAVGYIAGLIATPIALKLTTMLCTKE